MEKKRPRHTVGAARTLLDLALDYYEGVANLSSLELLEEAVEAVGRHGGTSEQDLAEEAAEAAGCVASEVGDECDHRLRALQSWCEEIKNGTAGEGDED